MTDDMTEKTWQEMTPEERNRLVAEKVMGYETGTMPSGDTVMWNDSGIVEAIPYYTQSMDAAWLVLQHMAEQEFEELRSAFAARLGVTFATWEGFDTFAANLDQLASWTPEKICLAAVQVLSLI